MPKSLGGNLDIIEFPSLDVVRFGLKEEFLYLYALGYHLKSQTKHFLYCYNSNTFHQMHLHHIVTLYLIYATYVSGKMVWGIPIMIISYFTDLVINSFKLSREIQNFENITFTLRIVLVISWTYNRVFIFLKEMIRPAYYYLFETDKMEN